MFLIHNLALCSDACELSAPLPRDQHMLLHFPVQIASNPRFAVIQQRMLLRIAEQRWAVYRLLASDDFDHFFLVVRLTVGRHAAPVNHGHQLLRIGRKARPVIATPLSPDSIITIAFWVVISSAAIPTGPIVHQPVLVLEISTILKLFAVVSNIDHHNVVRFQLDCHEGQASELQTCLYLLLLREFKLVLGMVQPAVSVA